MRPVPVAFEWDEINAAHLLEGEHRVHDWEVDQLLSNDYVVVPNKKKSPRLFLIGRTDRGRVLTVVIEPTRTRGTYRPITAWEAGKNERALLERS